MLNPIKAFTVVRQQMRDMQCALDEVNCGAKEMVKHLQCNGVVLDKLELQPIRRASETMSNLAVPGGSLEKYMGLRKK